MFNLNDKGSFKKNNGEKRKKCHGDFLNIWFLIYTILWNLKFLLVNSTDRKFDIYRK
jgi:hypothetical protein